MKLARCAGFLGVAAFISLSLLARLVDQQRQIIGTLRALGLSRGGVVGHTLVFGAITGLVSSTVASARSI